MAMKHHTQLFLRMNNNSIPAGFLDGLQSLNCIFQAATGLNWQRQDITTPQGFLKMSPSLCRCINIISWIPEDSVSGNTWVLGKNVFANVKNTDDAAAGGKGARGDEICVSVADCVEGRVQRGSDGTNLFDLDVD